MFRLFLGANAPRNLPHTSKQQSFSSIGAHGQHHARDRFLAKKTDKHREPVNGVPACLKTDSPSGGKAKKHGVSATLA